MKRRWGSGIIVRDYERNILATMCTTKSFIIDPTVAVVVAAWKAVKFGRKRVIVEGYTLKIVNMLRKEDCCKSR